MNFQASGGGKTLRFSRSHRLADLSAGLKSMLPDTSTAIMRVCSASQATVCRECRFPRHTHSYHHQRQRLRLGRSLAYEILKKSSDRRRPRSTAFRRIWRSFHCSYWLHVTVGRLVCRGAVNMLPLQHIFSQRPELPWGGAVVVALTPFATDVANNGSASLSTLILAQDAVPETRYDRTK